MRNVSLVVATGLLVLGIYALAAQAAQGLEMAGARMSQPGIARTVPINQIETKQMEARQQAAEQAKQRQIQQSQEAVAQFGQWGPDLVEAAAAYGQNPATLYRVMICESGGDPNADNGICKGLFQFNPGTWAGTPYGGDNIFDGHAQAMAAAWMFAQGRKDEWVCQ
ncbi:MAG: transglycosylase SLT domain-containing protein [Actinobacteria bacterium]|nr:transglycosylase SLT domain-containing protein [Actinomycetota bacterium]